jgi:hypothetical protein
MKTTNNYIKSWRIDRSFAEGQEDKPRPKQKLAGVGWVPEHTSLRLDGVSMNPRETAPRLLDPT